MTQFEKLMPGKVSEAYVDFLIKNTPYRIHTTDNRPFIKDHFLNGTSLHQFVSKENKVYWASLCRYRDNIEKHHQVYCQAKALVGSYKAID